MEDPIDEEVVRLPVRKSAISSVEDGLARLNSMYMDMFEDEIPQMVEIRHDGKKIVVKLVSDRIAPSGTITLRSGDMGALGLEEGDEVEVVPYQKLTDELKETWDRFVSRFRKEDDENEGGE